jgi:hypothetical protein
MITDAALAIATAWATRQFPDGMHCIMCQNDTFKVDGPVLMPEIEVSTVDPARGIPVVLFTCTRCLHIMLFPGLALGVT